MNYEEKLDKKLLFITEMFYGSDNERATFYALGMIETLAPILIEMVEYLNEINKVELNTQRPGGEISMSAKLSYSALKRFEDFIK